MRPRTTSSCREIVLSRWFSVSSRALKAGSVRIDRDTGATEDNAARRRARPGGGVLHLERVLRVPVRPAAIRRAVERRRVEHQKLRDGNRGETALLEPRQNQTMKSANRLSSVLVQKHYRSGLDIAQHFASDLSPFFPLRVAAVDAPEHFDHPEPARDAIDAGVSGAVGRAEEAHFRSGRLADRLVRPDYLVGYLRPPKPGQ